MKLYRVERAAIIESGASADSFESDWDGPINREDLFDYLRALVDTSRLTQTHTIFTEAPGRFRGALLSLMIRSTFATGAISILHILPNLL